MRIEMKHLENLSTFERIIAAICCIFGLPGNILTTIICLKALCHRTINFERKVFDLYLAEISILDTGLLLYWVIETLIHYLYSIGKSNYFSLMHMSAFSCYLFHMINRLFPPLCLWLITCFTIIRFSHMFQRLNTIRSNLILVTCLTIIFSIASSYLIVQIGYGRRNKFQLDGNLSNYSNEFLFVSPRCHLRAEYAKNSLILLVNAIIFGFLSNILPSMLTLLINIITVFYLKRICKSQNYEQVKRRLDRSGTSYRSIRSTLLVMPITYALCHLPYCIIYLFLTRIHSFNNTLFYLYKITYALRYISHSVNFYAYIYTNHRFRRDVILLLPQMCRLRLFMKIANRHRQKKNINIKLRLNHCPPSIPFKK